jgi:DNA polymerase III epsilon subunit-like protein
MLPDNFVVIDLETTGLDPKKHAILEIGATDATGRHFYRRCAMPRGREVEAAALRCNGIDPLDLGDGWDIESAMGDLFMWLGGGTKRWIMGGKNPQFDYGFLSEFWNTGTVGVPLGEVISRRCVDLHSLMYGEALLDKSINMADDDFSTDQLYQTFLDMAPEYVPHNALRGAVHEMESFERLVQRRSGRTISHDEFLSFMDTMNALSRDGIFAFLDKKVPSFMVEKMGPAQNPPADLREGAL